jgi:hypothetical protein
VVFWGLRWLVAALGGLAIATLVGSWGEQIGKAIRSGPAAFFDRTGGALFGAGLGALVAAVTLMVALQIPLAPPLGRTVAASRLPAALLKMAVVACSVSDRVFPGSRWLRERFADAERRASAGAPVS